MRRVRISNTDYIVSREQHGRDVELVDVNTGLIRWIKPEELPQSVDHEQFIVPDMVPLPHRDPGFLMQLREKRRQILIAARAKGQRKSKDPNAPPKPRGPSKARTAKLDQTINEVVPEHMRAFVKAALAKGKK